jgi:hypothetical protein
MSIHDLNLYASTFFLVMDYKILITGAAGYMQVPTQLSSLSICLR